MEKNETMINKVVLKKTNSIKNQSLPLILRQVLTKTRQFFVVILSAGFFIGGFLASEKVLAQDNDRSSGASNKKTIEQSYREYFLRRMKPLSSQFKFYHYFYLEPNSVEMFDSTKRQEIAQIQAKRFMDYAQADVVAHPGDLRAGHGFYVANDPRVSQGFGNTAIELKVIGEGLNYLPMDCQMSDFSSEDVRLFSEETEGDYLLKEWAIRNLTTNLCKPLNLKLSQLDAYGKDDQIKIRRFVFQILRELKIVALEYEYLTYSNNYCSKSLSTALVFWGGEESNRLEGLILELFTPGIKGDLDNERSQWSENLQRKINLIDRMELTVKSRGGRPMRATEFSGVEKNLFLELQKSTLGCQP